MNFKSDTYPTPDYLSKDGIDTRIMLALENYKEQLKLTKCVCCGKELPLTYADIYDHDGGWFICNAIPKQWISFHCDRCGYDNSLNKLLG